VVGSNVRYVAPGKIRTDGKNRIYLRSLIASVGATVEVKVGDTVIKKAKQHHVQPSEMISITVDGSKVEPGARVEVSLR